MPEFKRSLAVVIGINQYDANNGIPKLETAVHDAKELAFILAKKYQYQVLPLLNTDATQSRLDSLLAAFTQKMLPLVDGSKVQIEPDDYVLFYFAGHGIALDGLDNAEGPAGYLVPQDARLDDSSSLLPMQRLHDALIQLPCRHLLIILDCCFAGTFRWAGLHRDVVRSQKMYLERYERFTSGCAQQVITSAAYDEKALDSLYRFGQRGQREGHSPFADLLLKALNGAADLTQDGVLTATELYVYLYSELGKQTAKQTPELCQLKGHDKGEYIFLSPDFAEEKLQKAPSLDKESNPYRGLEPFDEADKELFFGRQQVINELYTHLFKREKQPLTVVLGASGTGKSSLVKAGLLPRLREKQWQIIEPLRPGKSPFTALAKAVLQTTNASTKDDLNCINVLSEKLRQAPQNFTERVSLGNNSEQKLILVIDQFEELVTMCQPEEQQQFLSWLKTVLVSNLERLQVVITLRSDFEPLFSSVLLERSEWMAAQFVVPPLTQDELREVIEKPAAEAVMYFEPPKLVDRLINDVVQMPGALPLLSFTLSELYLKYLQRRDNNRAMTQEDYEHLCGIMGSLTKRATEEYETLVKLNSVYEQTVRRVMLRMVSVEGGESARRRVPKSELVYRDAEENRRVQQVIQAFSEARLIVEGTNSQGEPYVEPAHDALVRGWDKLQQWKKKEQENIVLQRRLTPAALEWKSQQKQKFLWNGNPYLDLLSRGLKSSDNWYNNVEAEFVERSIRQKRKNTTVRWGIVTVAFFTLSTFLIVALIQRERAILGEKAASVRNLLLVKPSEALILAIQGIGQSKSTFNTIFNPTESSLLESSLKSALELSREKNVFRDQDNPVETISSSPDGKYVAIGRQISTGNIENMEDHSGMVLWNLQNNSIKSLPGSLSETMIATSVAFSPDGKYIVLARQGVEMSGQSSHIVLWNLQDNSTVKNFKMQKSAVTSVAFSPDGKYIASADANYNLQLWDLQGHSFGKPFKGHTYFVNSVVFSPDGNHIASGGFDKTVQLWDLQGNSIRQLRGHDSAVFSVAFSPDGKYIASSGDDMTIRLWNLQGNVIGQPFRGHESLVYSVAFSPDGKYIVSGSADKTVRLWDLQGAPVGQPFRGHDSAVTSVAFSRDGRSIISGSRDGTVRVWNVRENPSNLLLGSHTDAVLSIAFSPDGKYIASGSADKTVRLWNPLGKFNTLPFKGHNGAVNSVAFSPDSKHIVSGSDDKTVWLWNLQGDPIGQPFKGHEQPIRSVFFSPHGQRIISFGSTRRPSLDQKSVKCSVRLWTLQGNLIGEPIDANSDSISPDESCYAISIHPSFGSNSETIAISSQYIYGPLLGRNGIGLLNLKRDYITGIGDYITGILDQQNNPFGGHADQITSLAFSPNGERLVSGSADTTLRLWNLRVKPIGQPFKGHLGEVKSTAFSPDSQYIVSGSADKTVGLWDINGNLIAKFEGHDSPVNSVAFSSDGQYIVSGSSDKTVRLWLGNWKAWLKMACNQLQNHSDLKKPQDSIARGARDTCQQYAWNSKESELDVQLKLFNLIARGRDLAKIGNIDSAIFEFQEALKLNPNLGFDPKLEARRLASLALVTEGQKLAKGGNVKGAVAKFKAAQRLNFSLDLDLETEAIDTNAELVARRLSALP